MPYLLRHLGTSNLPAGILQCTWIILDHISELTVMPKQQLSAAIIVAKNTKRHISAWNGNELEICRLWQQDKLDCKTAQGTANNTLEQGPTSEYFPPLGMWNQHHASSNKSYAGNNDKDTTAFRVNEAPARQITPNIASSQINSQRLQQTQRVSHKHCLLRTNCAKLDPRKPLGGGWGMARGKRGPQQQRYPFRNTSEVNVA